MQVFLTGATGFVGRNVLQRLVDEGHTVHALVRHANTLKLHSTDGVRFVPGDVALGTGLDEGMRGCEAVIHLVGIIAEQGDSTFERVHHLGTRNVVAAAQRQKINRFVHMSALGVRRDGVSEYQTSKWSAEEIVRQSGIPFCIFRPSLIFGPGSGFVDQMLDVMGKAPLFRPVPGDGTPRFRPVAIGDVAACFVSALTNPSAINQTIELGGGDELSLDEVLYEIARCAGIRKLPIHIPMPLMFAGAFLAETVSSSPPVTREQLRMLKEGSTCDTARMTEIFKITPVGFRAGLRSYLQAKA
jgi:uncharacterized protein YbjT (DUF2867 family)